MKSGCQEEAGLRPGILAFLTGVQHKNCLPLGVRAAGVGAPQSLTLSHLSLLCPRFLMKSYLQAQASPGATPQKPLPQSVMYIATQRPARCSAQTAADFRCPDVYTTAWAYVSTR